jgi:hypothetical protein
MFPVFDKMERETENIIDTIRNERNRVKKEKQTSSKEQ